MKGKGRTDLTAPVEPSPAAPSSADLPASLSATLLFHFSPRADPASDFDQTVTIAKPRSAKCHFPRIALPPARLDPGFALADLASLSRAAATARDTPRNKPRLEREPLSLLRLTGACRRRGASQPSAQGRLPPVLPSLLLLFPSRREKSRVRRVLRCEEVGERSQARLSARGEQGQ